MPSSASLTACGVQGAGQDLAGFAALKKHLSYLPHSGSVLARLGGDLASYQSTKGSLHFAIDEPLPQALVTKLVETRMRNSGFLSTRRHRLRADQPSRKQRGHAEIMVHFAYGGIDRTAAVHVDDGLQ